MAEGDELSEMQCGHAFSMVLPLMGQAQVAPGTGVLAAVLGRSPGHDALIRSH